MSEDVQARARAAIEEVYRELRARGIVVERGKNLGAIRARDSLDGVRRHWMVDMLEWGPTRTSPKQPIVSVTGSAKIIRSRSFKEGKDGHFNVKAIADFIQKVLDVEKCRHKKEEEQEREDAEVRAIELRAGGPIEALRWKRRGQTVSFKADVPMQQVEKFLRLAVALLKGK